MSWLSASEPDIAGMKSLLAQLVATNTENPPGGERAAAELICAHLQSSVLESTVVEIEPRRANAIIFLQNGSGPTFAFNSHLNVVPAGQGWSTNPLDFRKRMAVFLVAAAAMQKGQLSP